MKKEWKPIPSYEGLYLISNSGDIKSYWGRKKSIFKKTKNPHGYVVVCLHKNKKQKTEMVHRIVGYIFVANPENKPFVNHKNGIKHDNRASNLEWVTCQENIRHSYDVLKRSGSCGMAGKRGIKSKLAKMVKQIDIKTGNIINIYNGSNEAFRLTGIHQANISKAASGGRKWAGGYKWEYV